MFKPVKKGSHATTPIKSISTGTCAACIGFIASPGHTTFSDSDLNSERTASTTASSKAQKGSFQASSPTRTTQLEADGSLDDVPVSSEAHSNGGFSGLPGDSEWGILYANTHEKTSLEVFGTDYSKTDVIPGF